MTAVSNIQAIQSLFEAFGMGDLPAVLALHSENAVYVHHGNPDIVPFSGIFSGIDGISTFFRKLVENVQFASMQPANFREEGHKVIHEVSMRATAIPTGKVFDSLAIFNWTFDDNGKIIHWENAGDAIEAWDEAFS